MSNYNDGTQPPSGEPPRNPNPGWQPGQAGQPGQPGSPWQNPPIPPEQTGTPWQGQPPRQPAQPAPPWQNQPPRQPEQPANPWQNQPPEPHEQPANPWQSQPPRQPDQPVNPWQTPPEPRKPYVPDGPPPVDGANYWAYEHPMAPPREDTSVMGVKDWLKCLLLLLIPCANIILPFVWAFGSSGNLNKKNFFRAALIMYAIIIGIYFLIFIFSIAIGASFSSFFR